MISSPLAILAFLFGLAAVGFWSERTRIGALLTGTVVVILLAILSANIKLIPHGSEAYDFVFTYLVPVIIPLFLVKANLIQIAREATRLSGAFLLASGATVLGVLLAIEVVDLSGMVSLPITEREVTAGIAGLFTSTYIGGSVNYAALGEITGLREDASFFSAATAVDNVYSALYLSFLALLPGLRWITTRFKMNVDDADSQGASFDETEAVPISAASLGSALAFALGIVAVSDTIVAHLDLGMYRYAIITLITVAIATVIPSWVAKLRGSFELGVVLSMVFFASIAAGADVVAVITIAPSLIIFTAVLLGVHALALLLAGRLFGLTLPELIIASNAAVLGATTAPALAAAKGWSNLVTPGVLVGVLGYALGTLIGTAVYQWLL
ncbi:MAG: hypothetical protein RI942_1674 [Pseudomonadota bacterium]|jgi:uncharacterized membrane protein